MTNVPPVANNADSLSLARFAVLPMMIVADQTLDATTIRLMLTLSSHVNASEAAWPSIGRLASITGVSKRHVQRVMKDLVARGYVERTERYGANGSQLPNLYRLRFERWGSDPVQAETPMTPESEGGDTPDTLGVTHESPKQDTSTYLEPPNPLEGASSSKESDGLLKTRSGNILRADKKLLHQLYPAIGAPCLYCQNGIREESIARRNSYGDLVPCVAHGHKEDPLWSDPTEEWNQLLENTIPYNESVVSAWGRRSRSECEMAYMKWKDWAVSAVFDLYPEAEAAQICLDWLKPLRWMAYNPGDDVFILSAPNVDHIHGLESATFIGIVEYGDITIDLYPAEMPTPDGPEGWFHLACHPRSELR